MPIHYQSFNYYHVYTYIYVCNDIHTLRAERPVPKSLILKIYDPSNTSSCNDDKYICISNKLCSEVSTFKHNNEIVERSDCPVACIK